jgi:hypothetical protein
MTIAQHATNILDAWKVRDVSVLGAALESASNAHAGRYSASRLENEQGEVLESIVDHLRALASRNEMPRPAGRNGALALLSHLSSTAAAAEAAPNMDGKTLEEKSSNSATKLPK